MVECLQQTYSQWSALLGAAFQKLSQGLNNTAIRKKQVMLTNQREQGIDFCACNFQNA